MTLYLSTKNTFLCSMDFFLLTRNTFSCSQHDLLTPDSLLLVQYQNFFFRRKIAFRVINNFWEIEFYVMVIYFSCHPGTKA